MKDADGYPIVAARNQAKTTTYLSGSRTNAQVMRGAQTDTLVIGDSFTGWASGLNATFKVIALTAT